MDGCLACKSCTGQCPIKVDVPSFRAKFLELYYSRYSRPLRDYLVGSLEAMMLPAMGKLRRPYNLLLGNPVGRAVLRAVGLVHTPGFSPISMRRELAARGIADATPQALAALSPAERARSVVLVQDAFTSWYETQTVLAVLDVIVAMGFQPFVAPFRPNGKPLHVHGFLGAFARTAARNAAMLRELGRERGRTRRRRYVDDADLSVRIRHAAGRRSAAAGAAGAGMVAAASGCGAGGAGGRGVPAAAALLRSARWRCPACAIGRRRSKRPVPACVCCRRAAAAWPAPMGTRRSTALRPSRSTA